MSQQLLIPAPGIQANFKPDFPVEIDWNNPLSKGLLNFFFQIGNGVLDLVTGTYYPGTSTASVTTPGGRALSFSSSEVNCGNINPNINGAFCVMSYFVPNVLTRGDIITRWTNGLTTSQFDLLYGLTSGKPQFYITDGSATDNTSPTGPFTVTIGVPCLIAGQFSPSELTSYANGVLQYTKVPSFSIANPSSQPLWLGDNTDLAGAANIDMYWSAIFSRTLSATEHAQHNMNPYQLLRPKQRDLWIPVSSTPSNNLVGTSAETQSASAGLSIAVPMVAASVQVQTSSGVASVGIPLAGSATATQSASGTLQITVPLNAQAIQQQAASGSMSISVTLAGNAIQEGYNTGALTNTASGTIALVGSSGQQQSASGLLSIGVSPSGASLAVQSASGNLTTLVSLTGSSVQAHQASGGLIVTVNLNADELQSQSAAASMTLRINLNADSVQQAVAQGYLSLNGTLIPDPRYTINALGRSFSVNATGRTFRVNALGRTFSL